MLAIQSRKRWKESSAGLSPTTEEVTMVHFLGVMS